VKPGEHKSVQTRILEYAEAISWTLVSREEAEQRREFDPGVPPADRARNRSLFFDDLLDAKVREFNPCYAEAEGALLGQFRHLHTDICGNREFVEHLRNRGKFFDVDAKRERDLILIDYDEWADKLEVKVVWLGVRPMHNKWASCSTNGHLNFNADLLDLDREL
jgi:type I restriction enzyme R subunit